MELLEKNGQPWNPGCLACFAVRCCDWVAGLSQGPPHSELSRAFREIQRVRNIEVDPIQGIVLCILLLFVSCIIMYLDKNIQELKIT